MHPKVQPDKSLKIFLPTRRPRPLPQTPHKPSTHRITAPPHTSKTSKSRSSLTGQRIFFPAHAVSKQEKHTASSYLFDFFVQRRGSRRQLLTIQPEHPSLFQFLPQLLQRPLFDSGHITPADPRNDRHLPLPLRRLSIQSIPQYDHLPLLFRQTRPNRPMQLFRALPGGHLFQQIAVLADHIHQGKRRPIGTCLDIIGQRNILRTLLLPPKIHQDFICYPPPNAFLMH